MRIAVTGSIATDHLMTFPGRFGDQLIAEQLDRISLSFLVDELQIRRGGCAANIAFGMGCLGLTPILIGAVGTDFADYRSWLERHGVDCDSVYVSELHHTARFLCTTDEDHNQIASFYTGAMAEARQIELGPIAQRLGGLDLVLISPNDPDAMLRHTEEARQRGIPFAADPSQQLARMPGEHIRLLVDGAAYLFSNDYEKGLIEQKTGWSDEEILDRVGVRVTTLGPKGVVIDRKGEPSLHVPRPPSSARPIPRAWATPSAPASWRPWAGACPWSAAARPATSRPPTCWSASAARSTSSARRSSWTASPTPTVPPPPTRWPSS